MHSPNAVSGKQHKAYLFCSFIYRREAFRAINNLWCDSPPPHQPHQRHPHPQTQLLHDLASPYCPPARYITKGVSMALNPFGPGATDHEGHPLAVGSDKLRFSNVLELDGPRIYDSTEEFDDEDGEEPDGAIGGGDMVFETPAEKTSDLTSLPRLVSTPSFTSARTVSHGRAVQAMHRGWFPSWATSAALAVVLFALTTCAAVVFWELRYVLRRAGEGGGAVDTTLTKLDREEAPHRSASHPAYICRACSPALEHHPVPKLEKDAGRNATSHRHELTMRHSIPQRCYQPRQTCSAQRSRLRSPRPSPACTRATAACSPTRPWSSW